MFPSANEQMKLIRSGAIDIIPEQELIQKIENSIKTGKPLRVKLGCDPSKPDLHIGHAVVLKKLRHFQDLGHTAVLIIGDFTAMIGDPSGKNKTRPPLTKEETRINGQTYLEQATKILSKENLEIRYNSEWLGKMDFHDVIKLASKYTVAQLLERDDFKKRYTSGTPISVHELLYPLAQAIDSVYVNSDIELGGTDQTFNLLVGREIQREYEQEPQCILTMPILEGTDGVEKMSKSLDNYIAITDTPQEIFGKVMSIPDELITRYLRYGAFADEEDVNKMEKGLKDGSVHPRDAKVKTAMAIVEIYHDKTAAENAFKEFENIFVKKDIPDEIDEITLELGGSEQILADVLVTSKLAPSKKEARRMLQQGAVSIDKEKVTDAFAKIDFSEKRLIKYGKRKFLYVTVK
jgi:tyrosyl-tRNA synthetase